MIIYKLGCVAYESSSYSMAAQHFRESIAISKLYPIPAEQARTQFMLAEALRMGGRADDANEQLRAEQMAAGLMQMYQTSRGTSELAPCSKASDFNLFITAKYQ